jgi:hypothetical protein
MSNCILYNNYEQQDILKEVALVYVTSSVGRLLYVEWAPRISDDTRRRPWAVLRMDLKGVGAEVLLHCPEETEENHKNILRQLVIRPMFKTRASRVGGYRHCSWHGTVSDVKCNEASVF